MKTKTIINDMTIIRGSSDSQQSHVMTNDDYKYKTVNTGKGFINVKLEKSLKNVPYLEFKLFSEDCDFICSVGAIHINPFMIGKQDIAMNEIISLFKNLNNVKININIPTGEIPETELKTEN